MNEMVAGVRGDVGIKVFGDDLDQLKRIAAQVHAVVEALPGSADVNTEQITGQPMLQIKIKQDQIARYGVSAQSVLDLVESIGSKPLGEVAEGQLRFPLVVHLPERYRASPAAIGEIQIATAAGERIPLSRLASVEIVEGPSTITREWGQRRITVTANVRGRDLGSFVVEAQRRVDRDVDVAPGSWLVWGGQYENLIAARTRLMIVVPIALLLIFVLLFMTFGSIRDALLVFSGVPLALTGGIMALAIRGLPFSITAGVGFIALSGVAVLNGIVMLSFVRQLLNEGRPLRDALLVGCVTRLRPVLMTALVASLGFVPMALATGTGAEVQRPLATVVIGGIVSSTVLTLLVLPALYLLAHRRDQAISS
jgi:cobalt-zinc-cadmium resistance protein CzcA